MPDSPRKAEERRAAALFGGQRLPASPGRTLHFEAEDYVGQVKRVQGLSLHELESAALEVEQRGASASKAGVLVVKRPAGTGQATPRLIIVTEAVWRALHGSAGDDLGSPEGLRRARCRRGDVRRAPRAPSA